MKAAQINDYGHADAAHVQEVDKPTAGEGQILVEVHASSINPWDTTVREGGAKSFMPLELPVTLGGDVAGVVAELGAGVTDFKVGDKVYGAAGVMGGTGAFAEFAAAPAKQFAPMPAGLDFNEAAAIVLTGESAIQAVMGHIKLQSGQKILIHGGAGGIGSVAIQIAKHIGTYVVTTASGDGIDFAKSLGADEVIDYKSEKFDELLHDFDAVFDTVAGETYADSFKVLKSGGIIVSMNAQPNAELMQQYGVTAILEQTHTTTESLGDLTKLIEAGVITVHIEKLFPLEEIQQAFEARENGHVRGKIGISIKA